MEVQLNNRFDRLTNLDISTFYNDKEYWICLSSIKGAFAYWVVAQNPNKKLIDINPALRDFEDYICSYFDNPQLPEKFTFNRLRQAINEESLASLPEVLKLNELKPDFIDLGALARNIFYMVLREEITQS